MKLKGILTTGAVMALCLNACTMTADECDPSNRDAGFLDKFGCTVSGSYSKRVEAKEAVLADLKAEGEKLKKERAALEYDEVLVNGSIAERQKQLSALDKTLAALRSDVNKKGAMTSALQKKIDAAQQQIDDMKKTPANASIFEKQNQLEQLKSDYDAALEAMAIR